MSVESRESRVESPEGLPWESLDSGLSTLDSLLVSFTAEDTPSHAAELDAVMTDWPETDWWDHPAEPPGADRIADALADVSRNSQDGPQILAGAVVGLAMPVLKARTAARPFDTRRDASSNRETRRHRV